MLSQLLISFSVPGNVVFVKKYCLSPICYLPVVIRRPPFYNKPVELPDGCTTVFLNTHGTNEEEIPENLVTLLKYIGSDLAESQKDYGDPYICQLQNAVRNIKASREMEARYMLLEEMLKDEWKAGHEKGRAEGHTEGRTYDILELLSFKPGVISEELRTRILLQKDEAVLLQYLRAAYSANSVEEFERFLS